jgi:hypothetical protein
MIPMLVPDRSAVIPGVPVPRIRMDERFDAAAFGCWPFMAALRRIPRKKIIVPIAVFFMAGDYILASS